MRPLINGDAIDEIYLSVNSAEEIPETVESITELLRRRHNHVPDHA